MVKIAYLYKLVPYKSQIFWAKIRPVDLQLIRDLVNGGSKCSEKFDHPASMESQRRKVAVYAEVGRWELPRLNA
ncbi:hypothetical protein B0E43_00300 [Algoriphagus sp. A40]|nr:hypothetical protein B0E43_00300 [Algoriphagus sp. A40]